MRKFCICISIFLVGILLAGLIIYHIPQQRQVSMWTCSLSGESVWVEINLKYYRRLLGEPTVKGTVTFDSAEYIDEESLQKMFPNLIKGVSDQGWNRQEDADGLPNNMIFYKKTATNILEAECNRIIFFDVGGEDGLEKIHFMYTDQSVQDENGEIHGISFFGPAETIEQAQQIAGFFGRDNT